MTVFVVPAAPQTVVPVEGGGQFPVRRVFCVGRNYADHAREMGSDPDREPPFFFTKPADAVTVADEIPCDTVSSRLEFEGELVVAIGKGGANIVPGEALDHVYGYSVGCDLTRRDLQGEAKKTGRPWDMSKGFDNSGPLAPIQPVSAIGHPAEGAGGQWRGQTEWRYQPDDLAGRGHHRLPVPAGRAGPRRSYLYRHPVGRRSGGEG
jgi:fumarylpyruvate hydrolase